MGGETSPHLYNVLLFSARHYQYPRLLSASSPLASSQTCPKGAAHPAFGSVFITLIPCFCSPSHSFSSSIRLIYTMNWEDIIFNACSFVAALFLLEWAADKFVDHTVVVAKRLGVSTALVSLLTAGAEWEEVLS